MTDISKWLIIAGVVLIVIGLAWSLIGKLPGDIVFKKGNTTFFFPIVTSIVISIVLSIVLSLFGRFFK
ncbi:DUF2905 domain-containing protein [Bacillaceae bacterium SIJ1]|uniref:DUF2905 domain-containing protein n=1 Tax=Litoribacterium kuwaitense TaxID=1398745 RepID=UPI0013EAE96C|nr:DUF2905 domain-containing protein [Litoribacterium kuwaitense]NGP43431.1 DUF2905 domain-containing protein [Litoribacterium kuwaitense]